MKKNNYDNELIYTLETDNRIIRILLDRINIQNELIEKAGLFGDVQCDFELNEHMELANFQKLESVINENNRLKSELDGLREKVRGTNNHKEVMEKSQMEDEIKDLKNIIAKCKEKNSASEKSCLVYELCQTIGTDIKDELDGIIVWGTFESIIGSISTEEKLQRLYSKIRDVVMQDKDLIIEKGFDKKHRNLAFLFDFYYENIVLLDKRVQLTRLDVEVEMEYDDEKCVRIGDANGTIKEVLIQGYCTEDKTIRSIVIVKQ